MDKQSRGRLVAGAVLIFVGVVFLVDQFVGGFGDAVIPFVIGVAFLAGYFFTRSYGLLIPGCILLGVAFGSIGSETVFGVGDFSEVGLGLGFVAIYAIDLLYTGSSHWWPLIPGGILIVTGFPQGERLFEIGWPLILIFVGLLILIGSYGLLGRRDTGDAGPEQPG